MRLRELLSRTIGEDSTSPLPAKIRSYGFLLICLLLYGLGASYIRSLPANHDVAWLLYLSGQVLSGAELYVDIIETNPPLVVYFTIAVKGVSLLTGVSDLMVFRMIVLVVIALTLWLGWWNLRQAVPQPNGVPTAIVLLVSMFLLIPWVAYHFGQREHLTITLVLPYLYAAAARARGASLPRARAILTGVLAAVGFSLKPFFLPVWLAVEAYMALRRSWAIWRRPENYAIVAFGLSYGISVLLFVPAYIGLARSTFAVYDDYWSWGFSTLVRNPVTVFVLLVLLAHTIFRVTPQTSELRGILTVATLMFLAAVFMQNKGWDYHWIHVTTTAVLLLTLVIVDALRLADRWRFARYLQPAALALTILALLALTLRAQRSVRETWAELAGSPRYLYGLVEVVEQHAPGGTIGMFAASVRLGFPLVNYTDVRWGSRFNTLWILPGLYSDVKRESAAFPYRPPEERGELETYFVDAVIADLRRSRPDLLIVDTRPPGLHMLGFSWIEYFSIDSRFRELFDEYDELTWVGPLQVFKRTQASS